MPIAEQLFTERFRPKTMDDIVLLDRVHEVVKSGLQQNILLYSKAGYGKTSLAKIISYGHEVKYLDGSIHTSVDDIRDIEHWCKRASLDIEKNKKTRIVIIDECEGISGNAGKALKGIMENVADFARFVLITNHKDKVYDPILSRVVEIDFSPVNEIEEKELKVKQYKKAFSILKEIGVSTNKEGIIKLVDTNFPDMRAIVTSIETIYLSGKRSFTVDDIQKYNINFKEIFDIVLSKPEPEQNYVFINSNYSNRTDDVLFALGGDFIEYIRREKSEYMKYIPDILHIVSDYQYKQRITIDKMINCLACIFDVQKLVNG